MKCPVAIIFAIEQAFCMHKGQHATFDVCVTRNLRATFMQVLTNLTIFSHMQIKAAWFTVICK
jgi:predicted transcriptional regulator